MALPTAVSAFTLTFGPYTDAAGGPALAGARGTLTPVDPADGRPIRVLHADTGQVILPAPVSVQIGADGTATVGPLPHTDDPRLAPTGFAYLVQWRTTLGAPSPGYKVIAVPAAAGERVDFDALAVSPDVPGMHVPVAVSADVVEVLERSAAAAADSAASAAGSAGSSQAAAARAETAATAAADGARTAATAAQAAARDAATAATAAGQVGAFEQRITAVETLPRLAVSPHLADLPPGGLLVQTGLGVDGTGFTLWIDDRSTP
jgi:hypothetical protein